MTERKINKHRTPISEDEARRQCNSAAVNLPATGMTVDLVSGSHDGVYIENVNGQFYRVLWNGA